MTPRTGRYVAMAAGLALAPSLTACAGASEDETLRDVKPANAGAPPSAAHPATRRVLAAVLDRVSRLTSVRGTMAMTGGTPPEQTEMKGPLIYRLKPPVAMRFNPPVARMRGVNTQGVTQLVVGGRFYLRAPYGRLKGDRPWSSATLRALAESGGTVAVMVEGDPAFEIGMFTASKDVHPIGHEIVRGVRTTHYQGTFDLAAGMDKLNGERRAQAKRDFANVGTGTLLFDVWVDGRRLPRRLVTASAPGAKTPMRTVTDYTAFDVPVSLRPPPQNQVQEDPALLGTGGDDVPG